MQDLKWNIPWVDITTNSNLHKKTRILKKILGIKENDTRGKLKSTKSYKYEGTTFFLPFNFFKIQQTAGHPHLEILLIIMSKIEFIRCTLNYSCLE